MKIVLTVFAPFLVAIGIRLALFLLALLGFIPYLLEDFGDIWEEIEDFFNHLGAFDTFDWEESWFYWILVIIGSFIAEYLIWSED